MLRTLALSTLCLLALDGVSTVLAPATGVSLTSEAAAADFTGRIKTIRIKKRRVGSGFKIKAKTIDEGDATAADAATYELTICAGTLGECSDAVEITQDSYTGVVKTGRFSFDGAEVPEGEFELLTNLRDANGELVGNSQSWTLTASGGELTLASTDTVESGAYISELTMSADDCGNGKAKALVDGDDAETVATVEWVDLDGIVFSSEDVSTCEDGSCVTGSLKKGRTVSSNTNADLDPIQVDLGELAEVDIELSISAYDDNGDLIGTTSAEGVSKYGDILIDGVPLEFDLAGGSDPIDLFSVSGDDTGTTVSTTLVDVASTDVLEVSLSDASTGKEIISTFDDTPAATQLSMAYEGVEFDPGEAPDDYTYLVLVDLIDSNGDPVGSQYEAEILMPSFDGETVGTDYVAFDDGTGAVGFLQGSDGFVAHVVYQGDEDVAAANVIFEEPYEGPAPLETEVQATPVATWTVYEQSTDNALPEAWNLAWSLTDAEGNELSSGSSSGTGATQSKNGDSSSGGLASNLTVRGNLDVNNTLK